MSRIRKRLVGVLKVVINISAALIAVAHAATPEDSGKPEPNVAKEIDSYLDSVVSENKLSGAVLVAKDGVTVAS